MSEIPLPKPADVARYRWRIGNITRFLADPSNVDHPAVMLLHVERSAYLEALKLAGYPTDRAELSSGDNGFNP